MSQATDKLSTIQGHSAGIRLVETRMPQLSENAQLMVVSNQVSGVSKQNQVGFYNVSKGDKQGFRYLSFTGR